MYVCTSYPIVGKVRSVLRVAAYQRIPQRASLVRTTIRIARTAAGLGRGATRGGKIARSARWKEPGGLVGRAFDLPARGAHRFGRKRSHDNQPNCGGHRASRADRARRKLAIRHPWSVPGARRNAPGSSGACSRWPLQAAAAFSSNQASLGSRIRSAPTRHVPPSPRIFIRTRSSRVVRCPCLRHCSTASTTRRQQRSPRAW